MAAYRNNVGISVVFTPMFVYPKTNFGQLISLSGKKSGPLALKFKKTPWAQSASELYRLSDRRLSAKLLPT
jgi:hypothetical protein